ncbi:hypothetical protein, partial [Burkholderia sp. AU4i]|uniref:hypothetical protein n=1 Tax=Burkholderia sp. AU4i TaxID=1335308 RepID=UPI001C54EDA1
FKAPRDPRGAFRFAGVAPRQGAPPREFFAAARHSSASSLILSFLNLTKSLQELGRGDAS